MNRRRVFVERIVNVIDHGAEIGKVIATLTDIRNAHPDKFIELESAWNQHSSEYSGAIDVEVWRDETDDEAIERERAEADERIRIEVARQKKLAQNDARRDAKKKIAELQEQIDNIRRKYC